jgi:signal transduction histidine kinase
VAGTLCGSEVQGSFARKLTTCMECSFYKKVREDEGCNLTPDSDILLSISDPHQVVQAYEELRRMYAMLKESQVQLGEAKKLEAIGRLAAGVAHEINTPTQYIGDNLTFLNDAFGSLLDVVEVSSRLLHAAKTTSEIIPTLQLSLEEADIAYLSENIPQAIAQSLDGVARVVEIVRAMKEFSHPGAKQKEPADLHRAIKTTLTVARNEWKYAAEVVTDFDESLPPVPCLVNEFSQVILNLVVNAAHAIAAAPDRGASGRGIIRISTRCNGDSAEIRISDNGSGIPKEIQNRIFEPFFTTKEVGKGTGQGLFLAYMTIVKKHMGTLTFESQPNQGTTFIIGLPLHPLDQAASGQP